MKHKIFIASVYYYSSGGAETMHQLADLLKKRGVSAYIYYFDNPSATKVPNKFEEYEVSIVKQIEDLEDNLLIVPETKTGLLLNYSKIKKAIYWLSLNFYLYNHPLEHAKIIANRFFLHKIFAFPIAFLLLIKQKDIKYIRINNKNINSYFHLYNCDYVKQFLLKKGVKRERIVYLCGPLNNIYFEKSSFVDKTIKEDIIVYNPKKGMVFTKMIINYAKKCKSNYKFIPIENLNSQQICNLLEKAKVYIDFGEFPGPERMPREAAMMMCNIITSNLGSAANEDDVLVPKEFKYEYKIRCIPKIYKTIKYFIENYEKCVPAYNMYRYKIIDQKRIFNENVDKVIEFSQS